MNDDDRAAELAGVSLFADVLDRELLDHLAAKSRYMAFPEGSTLMTSGDFGVSMFAIINGTVGVTLTTTDGADHRIADLGAGDIVGEMSLMTGARRNATVVARSDVTALEITKVALEEILSRAPQLIERFGAVLAGRQAELDRVQSEAAHSADHISGQIRDFFRSVFGS